MTGPEWQRDDVVCVYRADAADPPSDDDYRRSGREILRALAPDLHGRRRVVMKPNVTIPCVPDSGIVTHWAFIAGMADYFLEMGLAGEQIVVGEGCGSSKGSEHYGQAGYVAMAEASGIRLVNFNADEYVRLPVPNARVIFEIPVAALWAAEDTFRIDVPKLKTHNMAIVTLNIKNLQGVLQHGERSYCSRFPQPPDDDNLEGEDEWRFAEKHADLLTVAGPDLCVVEGIVGRDGTAFHRGHNIIAKMAVAGANAVAVDAVAAYLMGFHPAYIPDLRAATRRGLGTCDLSKLTVYEVRHGEFHQCSDLNALASTEQFHVIRHYEVDRRGVS